VKKAHYVGDFSPACDLVSAQPEAFGI